MVGPPRDMAVITLTTDFGSDSPYVAQMKASIYSLAPQANVVDVTHSIAAQDIQQGALVLADTAFYFPAGTIHVAVVDPGVGTQRAIVAAQIDEHWFVAPDNGLLTGVANGREITALRRAENARLWRHPVSSTFHGRDIMAPVAAHLSLGVAPQEIGPSHEDLARIDWPACEIDEKQITGQVIFIDSFGNLVTNIFRTDLKNWQRGRDCTIRCGKHALDNTSTTYAARPAGEIVALLGSSERLEIAVVAGNAAVKLSVDRGEQVTVTAT